VLRISQSIGCLDENIFGEHPEIIVTAHQAAQLAPLELLRSPELGQSSALAREETFTQRGNREGINKVPYPSETKASMPSRRSVGWWSIAVFET